MKKLIIEKIEELGSNVSFVDLRTIEGFSGDQDYWNLSHNWVFWQGVSHEFIQAIHELVRDGVIDVEMVSPMTYMIDGCSLKLPLVKKAIKYKSPRWLPLVLNKGANFDNALESLTV